jgi:hypothetical protein
MLGWIIDTVAETVELPDHRTKRFSSLLNELLALRRISIKRWKKVLGELRSMVLAIPGGRCLFSTLYVALGDPSSDSRIKINRPIRDALLDLQSLAQDLSGRHTRIGELVDTLPVAYSTADACGTGMGCMWLSPDPNFTPLLWQADSELELATHIDNIATRAWHRKGAHSTLGAGAYLLRTHALHQRHYRYRSNIHYIAGPANAMADDASRRWNLTDVELLTYFKSTYPQNKPWGLSILRPGMHSALISALQCKRLPPAQFLPALNTVMPLGFNGSSIVNNLDLTPCFQMWPTQSWSSKSLPHATDQKKSHPAVTLHDLGPWKQPFARLGRRWPAWEPAIHAIPHKAKCRVKPIPFTIITHTLASAHSTMDQAIADLATIGIFFLLRPGEHTASSQQGNTKPFRLCDVTFRIGAVTASVTLTFTKQKNGRENKIVGHARSSHVAACPVLALICHTLHLRHNQATHDTPLCMVYLHGRPIALTSHYLTTLLRQAALVLHPTLGFNPADISARSQQAGGAMSLLCAQVDSNVISKCIRKCIPLLA